MYVELCPVVHNVEFMNSYLGFSVNSKQAPPFFTEIFQQGIWVGSAE